MHRRFNGQPSCLLFSQIYVLGRVWFASSLSNRPSQTARCLGTVVRSVNFLFEPGLARNKTCASKGFQIHLNNLKYADNMDHHGLLSFIMDLMSFMAMNPCHDIDNMHTLYMDHSDYHDIMDHYWIIMDHWCRLFESMAMAGLSARLTGARKSTGHILTAAVNAAGRRSSTNVSAAEGSRFLDGFPIVSHGFPGKNGNFEIQFIIDVWQMQK